MIRYIIFIILLLSTPAHADRFVPGQRVFYLREGVNHQYLCEAIVIKAQGYKVQIEYLHPCGLVQAHETDWLSFADLSDINSDPWIKDVDIFDENN